MKKWYRIDRDNFLVPRVHIQFVRRREASAILGRNSVSVDAAVVPGVSALATSRHNQILVSRSSHSASDLP